MFNILSWHTFLFKELKTKTVYLCQYLNIEAFLDKTDNCINILLFVRELFALKSR